MDYEFLSKGTNMRNHQVDLSSVAENTSSENNASGKSGNRQTQRAQEMSATNEAIDVS